MITWKVRPYLVSNEAALVAVRNYLGQFADIKCAEIIKGKPSTFKASFSKDNIAHVKYTLASYECERMR